MRWIPDACMRPTGPGTYPTFQLRLPFPTLLQEDFSGWRRPGPTVKARRGCAEEQSLDRGARRPSSPARVMTCESAIASLRFPCSTRLPQLRAGTGRSVELRWDLSNSTSFGVLRPPAPSRARRGSTIRRARRGSRLRRFRDWSTPQRLHRRRHRRDLPPAHRRRGSSSAASVASVTRSGSRTVRRARAR